MPSVALQKWQSERVPRLLEIRTQCDTCSPAANPNLPLLDENLRAYVLLLSAHFQGLCRDLYSECMQAVAISVSPNLKSIIDFQFTAGRQLDTSNVRMESLCADFNRFAIDLGKKLRADPANAPRITHLGHLNAWRNYAAHSKLKSPSDDGPLSTTAIGGWENSCSELAIEIDQIMYDYMRAVLGKPPW